MKTANEDCLICEGTGKAESGSCTHCQGRGKVKVRLEGPQLVLMATGDCKVPARLKPLEKIQRS